MESLSIGELDRISLLPEPVIHCILSSLKYYPAELARMSVWSKTWFHLTASFPFLFLDIDYFTSRQSFFEYVEYATSRFCHHNLTAHMLTLIATIQQPAELDIVNRCLERLLNQGVKVLDIKVTNNSTESPSASVKFRLPDILFSVSALESLTVRSCELPSSFMLDVTRFKSLIQLTLAYAPIDDQVIKHLTTCCPLLQAIMVLRCRALKRFCVYGHQNLRRVQIFYDTPIEMIHIEAPNLSTFSITDCGRIGVPQIMNLASCKKLTTVSYKGLPLPNSNGFNDFLSNFPFIQNLVLESRCRCNNLKLSSHSLRTLLLHLDCDLEKIELSTPNLVSFTCLPHYCPPRPLVLDKQWHMLRDSAHLKACMHFYPTCYIGTLWFKKLRQFLDKKNGYKVLNLYIHASSSQQLIGLEKLKAIELPPYALEHVELQLDTHVESSAHVAFIDAVVWCFRPRSLTLRPSSSFIDFEDVAMFTYKKLLEQEDQGHTNIRIVWPSSSEAQKHSRDLKSLSVGLPREKKSISFIKE